MIPPKLTSLPGLIPICWAESCAICSKTWPATLLPVRSVNTQQQPHRRRLEFCVQDDGPGIDAPDLPHISRSSTAANKERAGARGREWDSPSHAHPYRRIGEKYRKPHSAPRQRGPFRFWVPLVEKEPSRQLTRPPSQTEALSLSSRLPAPVAGNFAPLLRAFRGPLQQPRHAPCHQRRNRSRCLCPAAHHECPRSRAGNRREAAYGPGHRAAIDAHVQHAPVGCGSRPQFGSSMRVILLSAAS